MILYKVFKHILGLRTRLDCEILMLVWSFRPLDCQALVEPKLGGKDQKPWLYPQDAHKFTVSQDWSPPKGPGGRIIE